MTTTIVIGDGPAGLSAALFLAKNGLEVTVLGNDKTPMHVALLNNYLGIEQIKGTDFQAVARRQVESHGATILAAEAEAIERTDAGFAVTTTDGDRREADYVILASGSKRDLAKALGVAVDPNAGVAVDQDGRTAVDGFYAAGRAVRPYKTQAIISAGSGAAVALDILSIEAGEPQRDWDVVEED
jgi:thioredoxin reductase